MFLIRVAVDEIDLRDLLLSIITQGWPWRNSVIEMYPVPFAADSPVPVRHIILEPRATLIVHALLYNVLKCIPTIIGSES